MDLSLDQLGSLITLIRAVKRGRLNISKKVLLDTKRFSLVELDNLETVLIEVMENNEEYKTKKAYLDSLIQQSHKTL